MIIEDLRLVYETVKGKQKKNLILKSKSTEDEKVYNGTLVQISMKYRYEQNGS